MCKDVLLAVALLFLLAPAPQSVAASDMSLRPKVRSGTPGTPLLCFAHSSPLLGAKERSSRHVHRMSTNPTASPDGNFQQKMAVGFTVPPASELGDSSPPTHLVQPRGPSRMMHQRHEERHNALVQDFGGDFGTQLDRIGKELENRRGQLVRVESDAPEQLSGNNLFQRATESSGPQVEPSAEQWEA
ncbi:hypothetical protein T484DRAFT_1815720 [Baffinella frigidus]|nr:hypothetical protein T484DRAFT_1815720 [Cryptophyta sp. CCMP2293]